MILSETGVSSFFFFWLLVECRVLAVVECRVLAVVECRVLALVACWVLALVECRVLALVECRVLALVECRVWALQYQVSHRGWVIHGLAFWLFLGSSMSFVLYRV